MLHEFHQREQEIGNQLDERNKKKWWTKWSESENNIG